MEPGERLKQLAEQLKEKKEPSAKLPESREAVDELSHGDADMAMLI